jgi:hypothetical protein
MIKPRPALCWYLWFSLSYRDVGELLTEAVSLLTARPFGAGCSDYRTQQAVPSS